MAGVKLRGKACMGHGGASRAASPHTPLHFAPPREVFWVRKTLSGQPLPTPSAAWQCRGTSAGSAGLVAVTDLMAPLDLEAGPGPLRKENRAP